MFNAYYLLPEKKTAVAVRFSINKSTTKTPAILPEVSSAERGEATAG